ncbi:hypothetical protein N2152v2_004739 [Parachlorella kessleri]
MARRLVLAVLAFAVLATNAAANPVFPFSRPALPYDYNATAPAIDGETNMIHYARQAEAAVVSLNNLLQNTSDCNYLLTSTLDALVMAAGSPTTPPACDTGLRRFAGSFFNHALFFLHNLAPYMTQAYEMDASDMLKAAIDQSFGNYTNFQTQFSAAANGVFGAGWAWLVADPMTQQLSIVGTTNQDNPLMALSPMKGLPILGLDVWEHAYWTSYRNVRADYVTNFYDVINWRGVSQAYMSYFTTGFDVLQPAPLA